MKSRIFASITGLAAISCTAAYGDNSAGDASSAPAPQAEQRASDNSQAFDLEEIIVTAEKRSESIQHAPLSVVAINGEKLVQGGVASLDQFAGEIPAVQVQGTNNGAAFFVRGIGDPGKSNGSSPVSVHQDGIYEAQQEVTGAALADLDRLEVLRGPQGTLYGRNATGGAVNLITNDPQLQEWSGVITAGAGDYRSRQLEAVLNAPIGDTLALRLVGSANDHDGYLSNGLNDRHDKIVRAKLLWEPNERLRVLTTIQYLNIDELGPGNVGLVPGGRTAGNLSWPPGGPTPVYTTSANPWYSGPYNVQTSGPNAVYCSPYCGVFYHVSDLQYRGQVDYDLNYATLTALAGVEHYQRDYLQDFSGYSGDRAPYNQDSVELRLASKSNSPIKWVGGLYTLSQNGSGEVQSILGIPQDSRNTVNSSESYAAFGQATVPITDLFRITGGLRYTRDEVRGEVDTGALAAGNDGSDPTYNCYYPSYLPSGSACVNGVGPLFVFQYSKVTYKVGAEYDLAPNSLLYADYSTGFRAGGVDGTGGPYGPETIGAYQIGSKNQFLDKRMSVNVGLFYYLYGNYQLQYSRLITGQSVAQSVESNVPGTSTVWGGEIEGQFRLTPNDNIDFGTAYEGSRFASATVNLGSGSVDLGGETLPRMPKWTQNLGYGHVLELPGNWTLLGHVDGQYKSSYTTQIGPPPSYSVQGDYVLANARLTLSPGGGKYFISAYINNITDRAVLLQSNPTRPPFGWGILGDPRTYGVVFSEHF
jgi:iron complex outermembrane receptor protein